MNRLIAISMAATLAACASTPATTLSEGRGLSAAWASLDAVAVTLDGLAISKVLHGQQALTAAADLQKATDALTAADAAYHAGHSAAAQSNVEVATSLISTLINISQHPAQ